MTGLSRSDSRRAPQRRHPSAETRSRAIWALPAFLAAGTVAIVAPSLALVSVAGLLPSIVAWAVETPDQPHLAKCVAAMNFAGVIPVQVLLVGSGAGSGALKPSVADPVLWAAMYGAAAVGWGLYLSIPAMVEAMMRRSLDRRERALKERRDALIREWGPEVGGPDPSG